MDEDLDMLLELFDPPVRQIALTARMLVREVLPDTIEQVDMRARLVAYGRDRTYKGLICGLALQRGYVNLMFAKGSQLEDPEKLLEGTGKLARHVKLRTTADVERSGVRALVEQAAGLTP